MADGNLTGFVISMLLTGLVVLGLVSSYVLIVNNEGRGEIFDEYPEIEAYNLEVQGVFTDGNLLETANINSNLSANYNPEISLSGADQSGNAVSINLQNIATTVFATLSVLGSLLFGGIYRAVISVVLFSIVGYLLTAYLIKAIRTGDS
jgi:hypothetical protein